MKKIAFVILLALVLVPAVSYAVIAVPFGGRIISNIPVKGVVCKTGWPILISDYTTVVPTPKLISITPGTGIGIPWFGRPILGLGLTSADCATTSTPPLSLPSLNTTLYGTTFGIPGVPF
jgi:hypothetical protein